jgi:hypothetical protein
MLVPLTAVLLLLDEDIPMDDTLRMVILGAIVLLICALAVMWIERHPGVMESDGADSLRGHHLLQGMTPYWKHSQDGLASEDDDVQFMPVRHGRSGE